MDFSNDHTEGDSKSTTKDSNASEDIAWVERIKIKIVTIVLNIFEFIKVLYILRLWNTVLKMIMSNQKTLNGNFDKSLYISPRQMSFVSFPQSIQFKFANFCDYIRTY